jgi:hypothetical protein
MELRPAAGDARSALPEIRLEGAGDCSAGVVHLALAGSPDKIQDRYAVIGGVFEAVLAPKLSGRAFGFWQLDVRDDELQRTDTLRGFFRELPPEPAKSASQAKDASSGEPRVAAALPAQRADRELD